MSNRVFYVWKGASRGEAERVPPELLSWLDRVGREVIAFSVGRHEDAAMYLMTGERLLRAKGKIGEWAAGAGVLPGDQWRWFCARNQMTPRTADRKIQAYEALKHRLNEFVGFSKSGCAEIAALGADPDLVNNCLLRHRAGEFMGRDAVRCEWDRILAARAGAEQEKARAEAKEKRKRKRGS